VNEKEYFIKLIIICAVITAQISVLCHAAVFTEDDYSLLRKKMVAEQIEARGISDKSVIAALNKVPRHKFVPKNYRHLSYADHPLPIGEGQTISQPYIVALMTEVIQPNKKMKVLEIGTGSGYQAAVLAELCASVYTIEIVETLGLRAKLILKEMYKNVKVKIGDGYLGWPEEAPFDAMIVTCAPKNIPEPLAAQLKDGGKMVIPVGGAGSQELVVMTKKEGRLIQKAIIPVRFVPMVDIKGKTY
jgi:protein-L-isoaspartate(D-aspartate) O-methyltransferase